MVDIGPRADPAGTGKRLNEGGSASLPLRTKAGRSASRRSPDVASQVDGLEVAGGLRDGSRAEIVSILAAAVLSLVVVGPNPVASVPEFRIGEAPDARS